MNHWRALELDGRWFYTCGSRLQGIHPVGYCAGWHYDQWIEESRQGGMCNGKTTEELIKLSEELRPFKSKFHDDGHETEAEAIICYRKFQLDTGLAFSKPTSGEMHACEVRGCQNQTMNTASMLDTLCSMWYLCDEHLNRENVEKLFKIQDSWSP